MGLMMERVKIGERFVGHGFPVFVIAEAGINHNGDMGKARTLIEAAAEAGADAVKFQSHLPKAEMLREGFTADYVGGSLFKLLTKVELSPEDHFSLKEHAESSGLIFLSTPFSREAADLLEVLDVSAFKVGSGELTNLPLLSHIAGKGRPMIVSTGMSEMEEIEEAVQSIRRLNSQLVLMQCTSTYPSRYEDVNLGAISVLRERFQCPVGLSDHSEGIYAALGAVALGAAVIEKHFTISRNWEGPDQKASIEPHELRELVKGVRAVEKALGCRKTVVEAELEVQRMARESVVSLEVIPEGATISEEMVWVKRPGTGIPARELQKVIGRKARRHIEANTMLRWGDLS
jgi:sialic acid synthase SpsE